MTSFLSMRLILFFTLLCTAAAYWDALHNAPSVQDLVDTVHEYQETFPCEECREHFNELLSTQWPVEEVHSLEEARVWAWMIHNMVNLRIGKPWYPLESI